ncbi:MAG: TonB-dependent receptor [Bacteroidetes bacterium]|nr:TonB-dependent receptor [Bacteroidota bacterium]
MKKFFPLLLLLVLPILAEAQLILFEGWVIDDVTEEPVAAALVDAGLATTLTDQDGYFELELAADVSEVVFEISAEGFLSQEIVVLVTNSRVKELGKIRLQADPNAEETRDEQIPTLVLNSDDLEGSDNRSEDISGILASSRDIFVSTVSYTFGSLRFRLRGYDSENTTILLNGVPMNELENGRPYWSAWGGLNDVTRNRETDFGLDAIEYTFGGVGGASSIDTRASNQRKQTRVSYAISNRSYRNRIMATYSTGLLPSGWAFSFSGSRRWAQEGYAPGSSYDAWSYFASIDKKFNDKHLINLTAFGAPNRRGRNGAAVQELNDLAGTNYYNPYWGFQDGEQRNSRISTRHQPVIMLRHDWNIGENATLTNAVSYQFGRNGGTALDWYGARDPRPDYYRYLPSGTEPEFANEVAEILANDEAARQIDWDYMYNVNYNSLETVEDVDGIEGNDVTGQRSKYIVEDRRYDSKEFNWNSIYSNPIGDHLTIHGGIGYQMYDGDNYKLVDDLLGGEFYVDVNRFVQRDFPDDPDKWQNDLDNPNRLLKEGDRFGYDYASHIRKGYAWAQGAFNYRLFDFFLSGEVSQTTFWREGKVRNGLYPESSFGNSEQQKFFNYGVKGGITYKINSRNFLYANGSYSTRAPFFRNSYLSPRVRDEIVNGLTSTRIQSVEGGYILRGAVIKARATAYYTTFQDAVETMSFFNDEELTITQIVDNVEESFGVTAGFVNYALTGIDSRHQGVELAFDWTVAAGLSLRGVAAVGNYQYTSRPTSVIVNESDPGLFDPFEKTVYQQNFFIPGTPQSAYTAGIRYEGKGYWSASLNVSYFDNVYIDFNPNRRTEEAVASLSPESPTFNQIIAQEKADPGMTVDFFGSKSFKINKVFMYLTVGVNNILNNQNLKTGGYEQLRFDFENQNPETYPARYYYYYGRNYFIGLTFRL